MTPTSQSPRNSSRIAVLDIGCGTGVFALRLAQRGLEVCGVDPAAGALRVAYAKPGSQSIRWIVGDATHLPPIAVDMATMTGNVAQAIVDDSAWEGTLRGAFEALRPGGTLVFETRDPSQRAWEQWTRADSLRSAQVDEVGEVEHWFELTTVCGQLVTFRWTFVFSSDGTQLVSESTLRFRERNEIEDQLRGHGYVVEAVRGAPDRPGREFVFIARRRN